MSTRSVIILPDDSARPILDVIASAAKSLRVKMFVFSDPVLLDAVIGAHARGVKVRVMLNPSRRSGEKENAATRKALEKAGVEVNDTNPEFGVTHEKSMVVDDAKAFIKSLNWATENLTETRDYAIITDHPHEVAEVIEGFEADWHRRRFTPGEDSRLIWCRGNGRERVVEVAAAADRRERFEGEKRARLASGVLGLDMYRMREPLAQAGLRYID